MAVVEKRTFVFSFGSPEEQVSEVDIVATDEEADVWGKLQAVYPFLKTTGPFYLKGFYESSPTGVYKPVHRVNWMKTPAKTHFWLDVATGGSSITLTKCPNTS